MMKNENIIQKQIVYLDVHKPVASAFAIQEAASQWCSEVLVDIIGRRLEKFADVDDVIRIDKLEIQLNACESLDEILAERIASEIEKEIQAIVQTEMLTNSNAVNRERTVFEAFVFFLQNGYLPWWTSIKNVEELIPLQTVIGEDHRKLLKALLKNELVKTRFLVALPLNIFVNLLARIYEVSEQQLNNFFQKLNRLALLIEDKNLKDQFSIPVKQELITALAYDRNEVVVLGRTIDLLVNRYHVSVEAINDFILSEGFFYKEDLLESSLLNKANDFAIDLHDDHSGNVTKLQTPGKLSEQNQRRQKQDGIYISNAGLVLLAPFIPRFFENLGIIETNVFNSKDLALALLQWLVTGNELHAEFDLVLPKIICGMEPEDPVIIIPHLPEGFKKEGEALLQSVIGHWSILKNTSVEGLRESFLQREGKLSFQKNEWLLQVEQKHYDMLLQHLPWNINMTRLSWMPYLLRTDWIG